MRTVSREPADRVLSRRQPKIHKTHRQDTRASRSWLELLLSYVVGTCCGAVIGTCCGAVVDDRSSISSSESANGHGALCVRIEATEEACQLLADARLCSMQRVARHQCDASAQVHAMINAHQGDRASV